MDAMSVSLVVLWILVILLAGLVFALARQVGVLHERIAPAGALALTSGPSVGERAPELAVQTLAGTSLQIARPDRTTLLFFVSPSCPVCKTLLPTMRRLARENGARLVFGSDGAELDHRGFVAEHDIASDAYAVSEVLGMGFGVARLPYAVLIDAEGVVRAQGLVNTREHVESLFEAESLGVGSVQEFLGARPAAPGNVGAAAVRA